MYGTWVCLGDQPDHGQNGAGGDSFSLISNRSYCFERKTEWFGVVEVISAIFVIRLYIKLNNHS